MHRAAAAPGGDHTGKRRKRHVVARPLRPTTATPCWGPPRRLEPWRGCRVLQPNTTRPVRSARLPPVCRGKSSHGSPKNTPYKRYSRTGAKGRHWDDRWPGDCLARANPDSHNDCADKSAWRCRPHGAAGSLRAWGQVVPEAALGEMRYLAHTEHNKACASGPRRVYRLIGAEARRFEDSGSAG